MKRTFLLAVLVVALFAGTAAAQTDDPKGWWELDDPCPADDSSGNGYEATCNNGINTGATGIYNGAYGFPDDDDFLNATDGTGTRWGTDTTLALSAWIKTSGTEDFGRVAFREQPGGSETFFMDIDSDGEVRFSVKDDGTTRSVDSGVNVEDDKWYHVVGTADGSNVHIWVNNTHEGVISLPSGDGNLNATSAELHIGAQEANTNSFTGEIDEVYFYRHNLSASDVDAVFNDNAVSQNSAPTVENVTLEPADPSAGDDVNVTADITDPDGDATTDTANLYVNQTLTKSGLSPNSTAGNTHKWRDIVTDAQVGTNYTIEINSTDGTATTLENVSFVIGNLDPKITILDPGNQSTEFTYDPEYRIRIGDDGDDIPGELVTCDLYNATNANYTGSFRTVSARENESSTKRTFDGQLRAPVGTHEFRASCVDGDETNETVTYTVDRYELRSNATVAETLEARDTFYNFTVTIGDMVDKINVSLYWNDTYRNSTVVTGNSQVQNVTDQLLFQPPIVQVNDTSENWNFSATYNFTEEDGGTSESTEQETSGTQRVFWAYFFDNESVLDPDTYFEDEDYNHEFNLTIKNDNSAFDAETIYNRTGSRDTATANIDAANEVAEFTGSQNVGNVTDASDTFNVSGLVNVSFRNRERSIFIEERELTVNRILLTDCSGGSASQEVTLQFNTWNESDTSSAVDSDLDMAIEVWNPDNPSFVRTYNFSSENASTHEFCISPTDATYTASTVDKLIQYEGAEGNYPKRSYFIINETLSNDTTTIPLYLLIDNLASAIGIEVENPDGQPYSDLIIRIDRYFPGLDKHITVAMSRTGSQGLTETFLETNEIYYQFTMYDEMEEVAFFPNQVVPPDNSFFFRIGADAEPGFFEYIDSVSILDGDGDGEPCVFDTTTFNCTYSSTTEALENLTLTVEEVEKIGTTAACTVSGQTSSGTLHCTGLNTTANEYVYSVEADFGDTVLTVVSGSFGAVSDLFGTGGVFIAFGIIVTAGMAGLLLQSGAAVVLFTVAGLVVSYWTNFLVMPREAIISIVAVAALLIWRMSR